MRLLIRMLGIGFIVAAAITYDRQRLRRAGRLDAGDSGARGAVGSGARRAGRDAEVVTDATIVDEAHRSVREPREPLPGSSKQMP